MEEAGMDVVILQLCGHQWPAMPIMGNARMST